MAITFPRQMPVGGVGSQSFDILRVDYLSPQVKGRISGVTAGEPLWTMKLSIRDADEDETAAWGAFIDSLRGSQRPFLAGDLTRPYPKAYRDGFSGLTRASGGAFNGTATSWSVNADRDVVTLNGLPAGFVFSIRDYVMWRWTNGGVQRRSLVRLIEPSVANGSGVAQLSVEPPLPLLTPSTSVADLKEPQCVMKQPPNEGQLGELDALHSAAGNVSGLQDLQE